METRLTQLKLAFMVVFLADFILEVFACEVAVESLIGLDCVLLRYSFCFHFVCPYAGHISTRLNVLVIRFPLS